MCSLWERRGEMLEPMVFDIDQVLEKHKQESGSRRRRKRQAGSEFISNHHEVVENFVTQMKEAALVCNCLSLVK